MTNSNGQRVTLSPGDWIKVVSFLVVQSAALIGIGMDMRERLAIVETQLKSREEGVTELRLEFNELRKELVLRRP